MTRVTDGSASGCRYMRVEKQRRCFVSKVFLFVYRRLIRNGVFFLRGVYRDAIRVGVFGRISGIMRMF